MQKLKVRSERTISDGSRCALLNEQMHERQKLIYRIFYINLKWEISTQVLRVPIFNSQELKYIFSII